MTAKEFLSQYGEAQAEIEALTDELTRTRSLAEKITVAFGSDGGCSGTVNTDKIPECVEKIMETEEKIHQRTLELAEIRDSVYNTISQVPDSKLRNFLVMRYIGGESFESISCKLGYTYNHIVKNLHPQGLEEINKILKQST